jgi:hypothetical protein
MEICRIWGVLHALLGRRERSVRQQDEQIMVANGRVDEKGGIKVSVCTERWLMLGAF